MDRDVVARGVGRQSTAVRCSAAALAALGLALAGALLPIPPESCLSPTGVASGAPSPTCGSDLRECLRLSAKEGLYGVRYVLPEDVATCVEAFNACIHGTVGAGGNPTSSPPRSTPSAAGGRTGLPDHFGVRTEYSVIDCRANGDSVSCTETLNKPEEDVVSITYTGTLSGMTLTGVRKVHLSGHYNDGCAFDEIQTDPIDYRFEPGGQVTVIAAPGHWERTSCTGTTSSDTPGGQSTGTWSAIN